ncbi:hypothetical protein Rs2_41286 [Raphanus sativus]|nr:hypothetical protein Rs2_41286 [Raphanus sativus]
MWQDTLLFIAQARLFQPRIQAFVYLVASLFCIIPSKTFTSFIVSWTVLQIGVVFISVMLLALLPSLLPNIRINLRAFLRNDVFAIVKTICSVIFFNIFFLYREFLKKDGDWFLCFSSLWIYMYLLSVDRLVHIAEYLGLTDGLIFAVYGQVLGLVELPKWAVHLLFTILILFKNLEPAAQLEDAPEVHVENEVHVEEEIQEEPVDIHVQIEVGMVQIDGDIGPEDEDDRLVQIAEDLGLIDGLIFAVYGQMLGSKARGKEIEDVEEAHIENMQEVHIKDMQEAKSDIKEETQEVTEAEPVDINVQVVTVQIEEMK